MTETPFRLDVVVLDPDARVIHCFEDVKAARTRVDYDGSIVGQLELTFAPDKVVEPAALELKCAGVVLSYRALNGWVSVGPPNTFTVNWEIKLSGS